MKTSLRRIAVALERMAAAYEQQAAVYPDRVEGSATLEDFERLFVQLVTTDPDGTDDSDILGTDFPQSDPSRWDNSGAIAPAWLAAMERARK